LGDHRARAAHVDAENEVVLVAEDEVRRRLPVSVPAHAAGEAPVADDDRAFSVVQIRDEDVSRLPE
jgi:hypothetical protein